MSRPAAPRRDHRRSARRGGDPNRRSKWRSSVSTAHRVGVISSGAVALAHSVLAERSNREAKYVFGSQRRMGADVGRHERTVRRQVAELRSAGLIEVLPGRRHQRRDGTWWRQSNCYRLLIPRSGPAAPPGRYTAPGTTPEPPQTRHRTVSDRKDTGVRSTSPYGEVNLAGGDQAGVATDAEMPIAASDAVPAAWLRIMDVDLREQLVLELAGRNNSP